MSFVVTQTMINRPGIRSIFYTQQFLDAPASVDEFKFRMGYICKPILQRIVFHPSLAVFTNSLTHMILLGLLRCFPGRYTLAKAAGMLRSYLQGKRSLQEQDLPECLADRMPDLFTAMNFSDANREI